MYAKSRSRKFFFQIFEEEYSFELSHQSMMFAVSSSLYLVTRMYAFVLYGVSYNIVLLDSVERRGMQMCT